MGEHAHGPRAARARASCSPRRLRWLAVGAALGVCCVVRADGGSVLASAVAGAYRVTVLSEPTPLTVGRGDVSVLVQDRTSGELASAVRVAVRARYSGSNVWHNAQAHTPTNRLYHGAWVHLDRPGGWQLQVQVRGLRGPAQLTLPLRVGAARPRWLALWPWLAWPLLPLAAACGWLLQQLRRARRARVSVHHAGHETREGASQSRVA